MERYETNPDANRNITRIIGEFFNKRRLVNGDPYFFLAERLVEHLQILIDHADSQDLELLAAQLFMNGFALRAQCPEQFKKLLNNIRFRLESDESMTKSSKLWLQLCVDGAKNKFGLFSADLFTFYQDQIGEPATAIIQATPSMLRVQTDYRREILDSYKSDVNVLKLCSPAADESSTSQSAVQSELTIITAYLSCAIIAAASSACRDDRVGWDGKPKEDQGSCRNSGTPNIPIGAVLSKYGDSGNESSSLASSTTQSSSSQPCLPVVEVQSGLAVGWDGKPKEDQGSFRNSRRPRIPIEAVLSKYGISADCGNENSSLS